MKSFIACVLSTLVAATAFAQASGYPDRPIKLVVGYSPGGGTDIVARLPANKVGGSLGQAIVVENRPGASGMVAAGQVAMAKPDGYTLMMGVVPLNAILPSLFASLPFDPVKDFVPVTLTGSVPHIIVVHPSLPVHSVGELIAYAKANPGIANFPSAGNGTTPHIAGELFKHMAGVNLVHIPYKSSGQSIPDLIAGRVTVGFDTYPAAAPLVRTGQVRAIAVTSAKRLTEFPNVPTVEESGLPGYRFATWYGIFAPAGTPPETVTRLHAAFNDAMKSPAIRTQLVEMGFDDTVTRSPEEFSALVKSDLARFAKLVKETGITIE